MTYRVIHDGSDRELWRQSRSCGVGASEVPILFGCGYADSSELRLFAEKRSVDVAPFEVTEGMRLGHRFERAILDEVAERANLGPCGVEWVHNKALLGSDGLPFAVCTPDGITSNDEPIEVKNICNRLNEEEWEGGGVPLRYLLQVQTQIAIMGASRGLFAACIFGGRVVWDWIDRDDQLITEIKRRISVFWARVQANDPPESNGTSGARDAAFRIAEKRPPIELFDGEIGDHLLGLEQAKADEKAANAAAKSAKAKRSAIEDSLVIRMGSAESAVTSSGVKLVKVTKARKGYTVEPSESKSLLITTTQ